MEEEEKGASVSVVRHMAVLCVKGEGGQTMLRLTLIQIRWDKEEEREREREMEREKHSSDNVVLFLHKRVVGYDGVSVKMKEGKTQIQKDMASCIYTRQGVKKKTTRHDHFSLSP